MNIVRSSNPCSDFVLSKYGRRLWASHQSVAKAWRNRGYARGCRLSEPLILLGFVFDWATTHKRAVCEVCKWGGRMISKEASWVVTEWSTISRVCIPDEPAGTCNVHTRPWASRAPTSKWALEIWTRTPLVSGRHSNAGSGNRSVYKFNIIRKETQGQ